VGPKFLEITHSPIIEENAHFRKGKSPGDFPEKMKNDGMPSIPPFFKSGELLLDDGLGGAGVHAGAALSAQVLVDLVVISTLGDGFDGAGAGAGAAGNASIGDNVHRMYLQV
jgi:hypothetical protein